MMTIKTEDRFYEDGERSLLLLIKHRSKPSGRWPGTPVTIRLWQICEKGQATFRNATDAEVLEIESQLDEVVMKNLRFIEHPTLGRVVTDDVEKV